MFTHPDFDLFVLYLISVLAIPLVLLLPNTLQLFGLLIVGSWAYLMKTIPETLCVHWIWYLRFYYNYSTAKMQTFPVILLSVDEIYFLFFSCSYFVCLWMISVGLYFYSTYMDYPMSILVSYSTTYIFYFRVVYRIFHQQNYWWRTILGVCLYIYIYQFNWWGCHFQEEVLLIYYMYSLWYNIRLCSFNIFYCFDSGYNFKSSVDDAWQISDSNWWIKH